MPLAILASSALALEPGDAAADFSDVPAGHAFAADVSFAVSKGWIDGLGGGTFRPDAYASRQSLWMALARVDGAGPADEEAAKAWAKANGLTDGTRADQGMSRQLMVTLLYNYAKLKGLPLDGGADISGYPDAEMVSEYAKEPLSWAVGNGVVQGTSDGLLNPAGTASRGHFAAFLHRFANAAGL